jgi:hypothetical protein
MLIRSGFLPWSDWNRATIEATPGDPPLLPPSWRPGERDGPTRLLRGEGVAAIVSKRRATLVGR